MAIKHNNIVPNVHFRKWWQRYVKTWFNQAGRKKTRRTVRQQRAAAAFPRPAHGNLRPVVHPPTARYNFKLRIGRGFTLEELKAAGIPRKQALSIGVTVDHRRRNQSEESLKLNADRLKEYKSKLLVFPRKGDSHLRKGDTSMSKLKDVQQNVCKTILPVVKASAEKARKVTDEEKNTSVYRILRKARAEKRNLGKKIKKEMAKASEKK